jgi:phytoene dehydrogenase-like protein
METQFTPTDVVIVGGGLAGLSAAAYLARAGVGVTLFEQAAAPGGRSATQDHGGFRFNRGAHALYSGGAAEAVLRELDVAYPAHTPRDVYLLSAGQFDPLPVGLGTLLGARLLRPADKLEFARVLTGVLRLRARDWAGVSVQAWLDDAVRRPRPRRVLAGVARVFVYSAALDLVSAEVFLDKLQRSLTHPLRYIDGGWQTFVDGLRRAAEQAGARIVTGAHVEAVTLAGGRAAGVRLADGRAVPAGAVIVATAPRDAARLLDGAPGAALRRTVEGCLPATIACLDVALRRLPDARHPVVIDLDSPRFLAAQSRFSRVAPEGAALIYTFKQLDPRRPADPRGDERDLEALLDLAQPGWRDLLVKRVSLPRIDAIGMLPTAAGGGFAGRPGPRAADLPGLYLAGDWIGPGFLADAALGSARTVARLLLDGDLAAARAARRAEPVLAGR